MYESRTSTVLDGYDDDPEREPDAYEEIVSNGVGRWRTLNDEIEYDLMDDVDNWETDEFGNADY